MTSTTFVDKQTVVQADWLNDVNSLTYKAASGLPAAVDRTGLQKLSDVVDIRDFGGDPTGVVDSSPALVAALAASTSVNMQYGTWKFSSTVSLPSGTYLNMASSTVVADCGSTPLFTFPNASSGLYILGGGGLVTGVASSFLHATGNTNQPTAEADYARQIRLEGVLVSSTTITSSLVFDKAVRQVFLDKCMFYSPNGIDATTGKTVEVHMGHCLFYSATGLTGTFGIKLRSTGGTTYYSEGWHIDTCTIDNFEISFDVTDIYTFTVVNSYVGCAPSLSATTGYSFQFQAPTTNLCESINIGASCVLAGRIQFIASGGGRAYNAKITGFIMTGVPDTAIALHNNASDITISNGDFKAGSGTPVGVVGDNNNNNIDASSLKFDSTYQYGVVLNGASGAGCSVGPLEGPTIGDIVGAGRSNILYRGIPIRSSGIASLMRSTSASNLAGATYTVGTTISSTAWTFASGEKGDIIINLPYSGADAANQNVQIGVPAGMVLDSGSGWSAANLYLGAISGLLRARVRYYCTADGTGNVTVVNQAGNTLTLNNQAYCGVAREC